MSSYSLLELKHKVNKKMERKQPVKTFKKEDVQIAIWENTGKEGVVFW